MPRRPTSRRSAPTDFSDAERAKRYDMPMIAATSTDAHTPLHLVELPPMPLRNDEVRIKVRSIGVNPVDWKMREGSPLGFAQRLLGPRGPLVVGIDFAGEVTEVGASVRDLSVGARVVGGADFSRGQRGPGDGLKK